MRVHRNPFLFFGQLDVFKKAVSNHGRKFLENIFDELSVQAVRQRVFTPMTTTWLFVLQVLNSDQSCRQAVGSWAMALAREGLNVCSLRTGAYCRARAKLPEHVLSEATSSIGKRLEDQSQRLSIFKSRTIKVVDGTTVSMPDTPENQSAFPQWNQKEGIGFPLARLLAVFSLSTGALLELAISKTTGKLTGEVSLFRGIRHTLSKGDLILFDRLYTSYVEMAYLIRNGIDFIGTLHIQRQLDLSTEKRIGRNEWLVRLNRPRPVHVGNEVYDEIQPSIEVRIVKITVKQKGFRTKALTIATSLMTSSDATLSEIAELYRCRWQAELYFRNIKTQMQMDVLRCRTPEMIRKEIWAHMLAYNLVRAVILEASIHHGTQANRISFKAGVQMLRIASPLMPKTRSKLDRLLKELIKKLGTERVGNRPDRVEPRAVKRRPKPQPSLMVPRSEARQTLMCAS